MDNLFSNKSLKDIKTELMVLEHKLLCKIVNSQKKNDNEKIIKQL